MAHTTVLTESQVRHVDVRRHDTDITYADLAFEGEARHVDEWREARAHDLESDSEVG